MNKCSLVGLAFLLHSHFAFSSTNLTTLRQVQVIFRHGARNIDQTYPLDPYKDESYWPPGIQQLTNLGKLQGYNLGLYLRDRYNGFVSDTYDVKEVYLRSSDINRCIQTGNALLAGFYLPNQISFKGNETVEDLVRRKEEIPLPWKSTPVHTAPVQFDNILRQNQKYCPRYDHLLQEFTQRSDTARQISEENKDLFQYFSNHTGLNITSPMQFDEFYDALVIEDYFNMTLPEWTNGVYGTERATRVALFYFQYLTHTFEMKRLRVGPLLEMLLSNMNQTTGGRGSEESHPKMYFFSGHDHCISGVLDVLQLYDTKRPPFTSALLLELHSEQGSSEIFVEIHYRNETDGDAYKLQIPNCGEPCSLTEFAMLVDPFIPVDWNLECQLLKEQSTLPGGWILCIILVFWVILFVALQCWIRAKCCGKRRQRDVNYSYLS